MEDNQQSKQNHSNDIIHDVIPVSGMYKNWFLEYASYVILERAVPALADGFKPVQRRILHAMKEMDDGRFNKVANIIGQTMQYHPHGDTSIGDAMVHLGQKNLLIDTQGNWGDIRTGDGAAAPRYIEARPSKFALDVVFNPQTTRWQLSYDGRKKEPVVLPVKFPLLLAQGVEGIAVGLSTKILPHNFRELIQASIDHLKKKNVNIFPDFPTGGMADFSDYNQGLRGGKIRIRAKIEEYDKKTLVIKDIPYGTTTTGLIETIIKANEKGKIKIKQVVDNTAQEVEILVSLASGQSPDITIDALYAFTDCELSISPNACVIVEDKPEFLSVNEILKKCNDQTVELLKKELEIKKADLLEKILFAALEKIFIENRIYRNIEECETWEAVLDSIDHGLKPFKKQFYREITQEDLVRLTEIKIKRISRFDSFKADEVLKKFHEDLAGAEHNLSYLIEFAVNYYKGLLEKYGKGRERKTEIKSFDTITAKVVAANNQKLYVNRKDGFVGYGLKKDEYLVDCSDMDDILVIRKDGKLMVSRITEKVFMGKDIMYAGIFKKNDERMVYNAIYTDGKTGRSMVKRFQVLGLTRDKEYDLSKGHKGSKMLYVTANHNGEAETVTVKLSAGCKARIKVFDFDFSGVDIKGRGAGGNILTKYPMRRIELKYEGVSTLSGLDIWYDDVVGRLNKEGRGQWVGNFEGEDKILVLYKNGTYELTTYEFTNRYEPQHVKLLAKYDPDLVVAAIYQDGVNKNYYVKRFKVETLSSGKKFCFISDHKGTKLAVATVAAFPDVEVHYTIKGNKRQHEVLKVNDLIEVKGWKSIGNKLSFDKIVKIKLLNEEKPEKTHKTTSQRKQKPKVNGYAVADTTKKIKPEPAKTVPEKPVTAENETDGFEVGSTIELEVRKSTKPQDDQLGLFKN